jgi:hypothetical protein
MKKQKLSLKMSIHILSISIIVLLLFAAIVSANFAAVTSLGKSGDYKVVYEGTIKKGWNLLPADKNAWSISSDVSEDTAKKIKAYYLYLPMQKKYVNALGGFNGNDFPLVQANTEYLQSSAAWYYLSNPVTLSYTVENGGGMPKLYKGWNMLSIGPSISVFNPDVKASNHFPYGDCTFEKLYMWNPQSQKWEDLKAEMNGNVLKALDELSDADAVGAGVAVKVKDTCQLGVEIVKIESPPQIPE